MLIDAHNPTLRRDRVHDPKAILVEERIELWAQRREASGLDLDQLAIGTHKINHKPLNRHLEPIAGLSQR